MATPGGRACRRAAGRSSTARRSRPWSGSTPRRGECSDSWWLATTRKSPMRGSPAMLSQRSRTASSTKIGFEPLSSAKACSSSRLTITWVSVGIAALQRSTEILEPEHVVADELDRDARDRPLRVRRRDLAAGAAGVLGELERAGAGRGIDVVEVDDALGGAVLAHHLERDVVVLDSPRGRCAATSSASGSCSRIMIRAS